MPASEVRSTLIHRLRQELTVQRSMQAAWLEGAEAQGRADADSDLDL
ncbi:hypothetical protein [Deinococcus sp.]|nr:hypothetical protein [Deinococcus sp.]